MEELLSKLLSNTAGSICAFRELCVWLVWDQTHITFSMQAIMIVVLGPSLPLTISYFAAYKSLKNLRSLHTSLTSQLDDTLQLTHIKLYHTATYVNLNVLAANLPDLRCLEGLPFRAPSDPKNYWPLRQCRDLEKLIMHQGCVHLPCGGICCEPHAFGTVPRFCSSRNQAVLCTLLSLSRPSYVFCCESL